MSNFQPLEVVDYSSDTLLQVVENLNKFSIPHRIRVKVHFPSINRLVCSLTDSLIGIYMLEIKY